MVEPAEPEEPPAPGAEPVAAWPLTAVGAAAAVSLVALALAAAKGQPYLDLGSLNIWVAVFAASFFGALFAIPFAVNRALVAMRPEQAESWEAAMVIWGAVALATLLLGGMLVFAGGFSPSSSLADAAGVLLVAESAMVLVVLGSWLLLG